MSVRLRLDLGYDGASFSGWAVQPGRRTVAGEFTAALSRLFSDARNLTVAGRTDAGVHATGQVCHIDVPQNEWLRLAGSIVHRLAGLLPLDVRVYRVAEAPATFDARFSALSRRYEYRVTDAVYGAEPLRRHDTAAWPRTLDLDALNTAATGLVGKHDFAAFCRRREHATTIRVISRMGWRRGPDGVYVATVVADAFCQSMVRSLVGAQLYVGDGRRPPAWPASLLTMRERSGEVSVAPAHGLTLVEVRYPADAADLERRAVMARRRRDELDPPRDELSRLRDDSHGPGR
jgi:tRNA pseudouridine38-40 synthase